MSLTTEQIVGIVTVVVGFTEIIKLSKYIPDRFGLGIAAVLSALGEFLFIYSQPEFAFVRTAIWPVVSAYLVILSAAAGVYGIIRESRGGDVTSAARTGFDGQRAPMDDTTGSNSAQREQSRGGSKLPMWLIAILGGSLMLTGCAGKNPNISPERQVALYGTQVVGYLAEVKTSADNLFAKQVLSKPAYERTLEVLLKANEAGVQLADALAAYDAATTVTEQNTVARKIDAALAGLQVLLPQIIPADVSMDVRTRLNHGIAEVQRLILTIMRFTAPQPA